MVEILPDLKGGYNSFTEVNGKHGDMLMDVGNFCFHEGEEKLFYEEEKETAFLILTGKVKVSYNNAVNIMERESLFDQRPYVLHVPKKTSVQIEASIQSEVLIIKATNEGTFEPVFYRPDDVSESILGDDDWDNTARRVIRDVFNYENAPYSKLVVGEIINLPGRWSSYPPHKHPQPEVYYHRFDKPSGFGCSIIGDEVYKLKDNSISCVPGGLVHPQVSAPGYAMYYCWIIRHLKDDPWEKTRIFDEEHTWLLDENAKIWEPRI